MSLLVMLVLCAGDLPAHAQSATPSGSATPSTSATPSAAEVRQVVGTLLADLQRLLGAILSNQQTGQATPGLEQLVGQKLMVRMSGHSPSRSLLTRIERGEIGGVVLLGANIEDRTQLRALTDRLQEAATTGGQPPLLIALDQEGGSVRRVPWAPPTLTVPRMGALASTDVARRQGRRTGAALRSVGVNMDLAPVADVPRSADSFMYQQGRTFGFDAAQTARLADAFAMGLADRGVIATMKHFPGIGLAVRNTDHAAVTIDADVAA